MENNVIISTLPVELSTRQRNKPDASLRTKLAYSDLMLAKESITRNLKHNIPVNFNFDIHLTLSINTTTFKVHIDYSAIPYTKSKKLIKQYLTGDLESFASSWISLN